MPSYYLPAIHIPQVPDCLVDEQKLAEYIMDYHNIGEVSHVDITKRKNKDTYMAFIHFKCPWNYGKLSSTLRKTIAEKGHWEDNLKTGCDWLDWVPEGDTLYIRLIRSDGRGKQQQHFKVDEGETILDQMELITKLDSAKIIAQTALIAQLCKELTEERKKNRDLEQKLDDVYKTVFGGVDELDMDIPSILNLDDLLM
jgi:hypothetical protein